MSAQVIPFPPIDLIASEGLAHDVKEMRSWGFIFGRSLLKRRSGVWVMEWPLFNRLERSIWDGVDALDAALNLKLPLEGVVAFYGGYKAGFRKLPKVRAPR